MRRILQRPCAPWFSACVHLAVGVSSELARALERPDQRPQAGGLHRLRKSAHQALGIRRSGPPLKQSGETRDEFAHCSFSARNRSERGTDNREAAEAPSIPQKRRSDVGSIMKIDFCVVVVKPRVRCQCCLKWSRRNFSQRAGGVGRRGAAKVARCQRWVSRQSLARAIPPMSSYSIFRSAAAISAALA